MVARMIELHPDTYRLTVSTTTRPPRPGEQDGIDYHFMNRELFEQAVAGDEFIESATYDGNYYGTRWSELAPSERIALRIVEDEGAKSLRDRLGSKVKIAGILAPSQDALTHRLQMRGDRPDEIEGRLLQDGDRADTIRLISDFTIVNDDLTIAADMLHRHITGDMSLTEKSAL